MADGMKKLRLDKYLADMQAGTRSEVKRMIRKGRVCLNGETVRSPEQKVDPGEDTVTLDGNAEQTAGCGLRHGGPAGSDGGVPAA